MPLKAKLAPGFSIGLESASNGLKCVTSIEVTNPRQPWQLISAWILIHLWTWLAKLWGNTKCQGSNSKKRLSFVVCEISALLSMGLCLENKPATYCSAAFLRAWFTTFCILISGEQALDSCQLESTPFIWQNPWLYVFFYLFIFIFFIPHETVNHVTLRVWRFCNCHRAAPDRYLGQVFGLSLNSIKITNKRFDLVLYVHERRI